MDNKDKSTESSFVQFWRVAASGLVDPSDNVPPTWSFGDTSEMANRLLALVLSGKKTATTGLYQEYIDGGESLPIVGELSIILDGDGLPRALVREAEVVVTRFGDITPAQAAAEGEGDQTLESWRANHRAFFEGRGHTINNDSLVVWERFEVLYMRLQSLDRPAGPDIDSLLEAIWADQTPDEKQAVRDRMAELYDEKGLPA